MGRFSRTLGLAWFLGLPALGFGQSSAPDELHRQLSPGVTAPYGGANFMERYNYHPYQPLYLNWDSSRFYSLEYLDRLDRLEKFGHRWPSAKFGTEFQVNRVDQEYARRVEQVESPRVDARGGFFFGRFRR